VCNFIPTWVFESEQQLRMMATKSTKKHEILFLIFA